MKKPSIKVGWNDVAAIINLRDNFAQFQRLERAVIVAARDSHAVGRILPELSTAIYALDQHMTTFGDGTKAPLTNRPKAVSL